MKPTPSTLVLILVLGLVFLADSFAPQASKGSEASNDFDFFILVQVWPGSFCKAEVNYCFPMTGKPASNFSIHGFWPNYRDGSSYPRDCSSTAFREFEISGLIPRMESNWPKLTCPSSDGRDFWTYQWVKHGTCSEFLFIQHDYFKTALNRAEEVDLLGILETAGIKPMNGRSHKISSIKKAIHDVTKFTPIIHCKVDRKGNKQLFEIWRCVTRDGSKFMECPKIPKAKLVDKEREECGEGDAQIHFPSFDETTSASHDEL